MAVDTEDFENLEDEHSTGAESFESSEQEDELELGEFEDLNEFFGDESSDATDVIFGNGDGSEADSADEVESVVEEFADADEEASAAGEELEDSLEFSSSEVEVAADLEEGVENDDENALEFELNDLAPDETSTDSPEGAGIDLEDKFGYTEPDITKDLGPDAEADFEESIEVHSTDMGELLIPSDDESESDEGELFLGESPDVSDQAEDEARQLLEEVDDEVDSLLEGDETETEEESSEESVLEVDEDLDLDEDMDADLGDLDLGDDELSAEDADEEFLTKLELAEAYIEMGDVQGAKELLSEVEKDGNAEQKAAAKSLLEGVNG